MCALAAESFMKLVRRNIENNRVLWHILYRSKTIKTLKRATWVPVKDNLQNTDLGDFPKFVVPSKGVCRGFIGVKKDLLGLGFLKVRDTFLGGPLIRIRMCIYIYIWEALYWSPPILGNYLFNTQNQASCFAR